MTIVRPPRFERYVAIGDSSTEGLDDPDGLGGYRGWSNRLAERIARTQGRLLYANLAVRGTTTREIREQQLERAAAMRPDLVTLFSGTNDVFKPRFDADALAADIDRMQRTLISGGATLLTFTLPDLTPILPLARPLAPRIRALNEALRSVSRSTGAILVDFAAHPGATDPRLWSEDRFHANAIGHGLIADALAHALGLPGSDDSWMRPLPEKPAPGRSARIAAELRWMLRFMVPWMRGGLGDTPAVKQTRGKRPELEPVDSGRDGSHETLRETQ
jgi:lysophospholipase L1-like esterase